MRKLFATIAVMVAVILASWGTGISPKPASAARSVICSYCDGAGGTRPTCDYAHAGESWYDESGGYHYCTTDGTHYWWV